MTQDELKLVFNALKQCNIFAYAGGLGVRATAHTDALAILEKALAQEQEPWCMKMNGCKTKCEDCPVEVAQPEQPKVRTGGCLLVGVCASEGHKIAPQRTWVGLTDKERSELVTLHHGWNEYGQAIEAKLKELNT